MNSQVQNAKAVKRTVLWYIKWAFASYAAALALFLVIFVASLPFVGTSFADAVFEHRAIFALIFVAVAPITFRFLK
ncbi:MAG: hypothetical protein J0I77_02645 [Rudaea sp.]|uniref:hypothetical protein n=1 Tax=unclassified Rudaea TaxID=2627037 RepID=UPI0010F693E0|nr:MULTISPECIES: hypothetical protein [unclassified Rudaea]MBN8884597.1 hypothetical protein [Rudaea sp.]